MGHYYTTNRDLENEIKTLKFNIRGREVKLQTNSGVFSKGRIDFGTLLLLETFEFNKKIDGNVLDLGCGYGPIALTLALENPDLNYVLIDINERALDLAKANAAINRVENVDIFKSNGFENVKGKFASIVTNPPIRVGKKVIHDMIDKAFEHLSEEGEFWAVIQKKQGAGSYREKMEQVFGNVELKNRDKGYQILYSVKKGNIKSVDESKF